jgi:hypothetical protein
MPRQKQQVPESFIELRFPLGGVDLSQGFDRQPNIQLPSGEYARTTPLATNVRAYEPTSQRARGGSRPGMQKYVQGQIDSPRASHVQELNVVVATGGTIPGSTATVPAIFYYDLTGNITLGNGGNATWGYAYGVISYQTIVGIGSASGGPTVCVVDGRQNEGIPSHYTYQIVQNGQVLASGNINFQAGVYRPVAATACTDLTNYYIIGGYDGFTTFMTEPTPCLILMMAAVTATGALVWTQTQACVGAAPIRVTAPTVDTLPCGATGGKLYLCALASGGYGTVIVCDTATGLIDASPVLNTDALEASGYQVMAFQGNKPQQAGGGLMTFGSGKLAVMTWRPGDKAAYGVTLVNLTTGAVQRVTGLAPLAAHVPQAIDSDGTDFYVSVSTATINGTQCVQKISGTTGAVLWTSPTFLGTGPLSYFGAASEVIASGNGSSVAIDPATGAFLGAGVGQNIVAFSSAGSYSGGGTPVQPSDTSQPSQAQVLVGVAGGTVKVAYGGSWQAVTNGSQVLNQTVAVVRSAPCEGKLYFLDTTAFKDYNPATNAVETWTATAGALPTNLSTGQLPRLICNWRGRLCLAGIPGDPYCYDVDMSAQADPTNFDYFPAEVTPTQAVSLSTGPFGLLEDTVTCLIPYNDDILIIGGNHTIYQLSGDPMENGHLDKISGIIGMAWGNPWCLDPYGAVYFMSNRCGIYKMEPGGKPVRISQQIEQLLTNIPLSTVIVRLFWDDQLQGVHVFITPFGAAANATHFYWDYRIGAWFVEQFANNNLNPMCGVAFYGSNPNDRVVILGSWDGYARAFQLGAPDDDGTAIQSQVLIGPIVTKDFDDITFKDLQGVLGTQSGSVAYSIYAGTSAQQALSNAAVSTGTWSAGRNLTSYVRQSAHALYAGISASNPWSMESIRVRVAQRGKVRQRGY